MAVELKAVQSNIVLLYRFIDKDIFIKANNPTAAAQVVANLKAKGAEIEMGKGWMRCNLFGKATYFKLGEEYIDLSIDRDSEIEAKLVNFFEEKLKQAKFSVERKEL